MIKRMIMKGAMINRLKGQRDYSYSRDWRNTDKWYSKSTIHIIRRHSTRYLHLIVCTEWYDNWTRLITTHYGMLLLAWQVCTLMGRFID